MIVILSKACILKSLTYYVLGSMQSASHEFFHVIFIAGPGADVLSTVSEGRKATCARTRSCSVEECGPKTDLLDSKKVALNPASPEVTAWSQKHALSDLTAGAAELSVLTLSGTGRSEWKKSGSFHCVYVPLSLERNQLGNQTEMSF